MNGKIMDDWITKERFSPILHDMIAILEYLQSYSDPKKYLDINMTSWQVQLLKYL